MHAKAVSYILANLLILSNGAIKRGRHYWRYYLAIGIPYAQGVFVLVLLVPVLGLAGTQRIVIKEGLLQAIAENHGEAARTRVAGWRELMVKQRESEEYDDRLKMEQANDYFNQVRWVSDFENWGQEDYWATPVETLVSNGGDCEDFSIGKYFTLLETQVPIEKLRITYVKSLSYNQAHMVVAYYPSPDAEPLILDNINGTILPASQRSDLLPVYSFNGDSIWLAKERGRKLKANSMASIPQWRGVNERMLEELSFPKSF